MTWTTLRSFSAVAAESDGHPSTFVQLVGVPQRGHKPRLIELGFASSSAPSVANSPTSVTIDLYKKVDSQTNFVASWTIAATDITAARIGTFITEGYADQYAAKVRFSGGTSPTLTGTLNMRAVE